MIIVIQVKYTKSNECHKNICLSSVYVHEVICICLSIIKLGMGIPENVINAIYKSRKTIIVMSKNFLKSMWGQYELQQAHNKAIVKVTVILVTWG